MDLCDRSRASTAAAFPGSLIPQRAMRSVPFRFGLLFLSIAAALALAFATPYAWVLRAACHAGYWLTALLFAAFLFFLWRELDGAGGLAGLGRRIAAEKRALALLAVLAGLLQIHEPHRAKVLYDEDVLCGTALRMHEDRLAVYPVRMHFFDGRLTVFNSTADKRPPFFPFALSLVHDLTGYRTANVFILNALLAFGLLSGLYYLVRPLAGAVAAAAAAFLMAGLPLLAQNATGASFEVMNLFLITVFALAGRRFLAGKGAEGLGLFLTLSLLLAATRYESALYLFTFAGLVLFKWVREKRVTLPWAATLSPLLFLPSLFACRVLLTSGGLQTKTEGTFFSLSYLPGNLEHIFYYLFCPPSSDQTNSLLFSLVGLAALTVFLVTFFGSLARREGVGDARIVLFATVATILATSSLSLIDNWGQWDDGTVARYSLPFHLAMALAFGSALPLVFRGGTPRWVPLAAGGGLLLCSLPQSARHEMTDRLPLSADGAFLHDWMEKNTTVRDLFVDQSAIGIMLAGRPAVPYPVANDAPWKLAAVIQAGVYENVFLVEHLAFSAQTGTWRALDAKSVPDPSIHSEPVLEYRSRLTLKTVISRVTGVDDPDAEQHAVPADPDARVRRLYEIMP
jgi:hypothetical protein